MKMRNFIFYSALLFILVIFNLSCVIRIVDYGDPRGLVLVKDFHRSIPFSPGGVVSLRNFDGMIEITGWDRNEIDVYGQKMIPKSEREEFSFLGARKDRARIYLQKYEDYDVYIHTKSISEKADNTFVDYYIKTPRLINLEYIFARNGEVFIADIYGSASVKLEQGNIDVENFSGSLDASVIKGSIQASLYDLRDEDVITLSSREGDITLFLQKNVNAEIRAFLPQGELKSEFELAQPREEAEVYFKLGEGGASVFLTALDGNINLKIIKSD
jgi:DUF4097 and DUF4098 domain-containing protein YvlB